MSSKTTALNERYVSDKATFIKLGDWEVPDYFTSPEEEYQALTTEAGLTDISHDGRIKISGDDRDLGVDLMTTIKMDRLPMNSARDAFILNDKGGILDMVNIFRTEKFYQIQTSCLAFDRLMTWLQEKAAQLDSFEIADATTSQCTLEVRGPNSRNVMQAAIMDGLIPDRVNHATFPQIAQARCMVVYYRDNNQMDRFRITTGAYYIESVYSRFLSIGENMNLKQVGWRAQEMFRIENFVPAIGAEFDDHTTPLEIGLGTFIDFGKDRFVGRRALLHSTTKEFQRKLVKFKFDGGFVPEPGDPIELDNVPIGYITSATFSPRQNCCIGMGFVDFIQSQPGSTFQVKGNKGQNVARVVEINELINTSS